MRPLAPLSSAWSMDQTWTLSFNVCACVGLPRKRISPFIFFLLWGVNPILRLSCFIFTHKSTHTAKRAAPKTLKSLMTYQPTGALTLPVQRCQRNRFVILLIQHSTVRVELQTKRSVRVWVCTIIQIYIITIRKSIVSQWGGLALALP